MRRLLQTISDELERFIKQRDNLALLLCSPTNDAVPILKIIEGLEETSASDLFWTFTDNFSHAAAYADAVVEKFVTVHEATRLSIEKEGMTPWPLFPSELHSKALGPAQRLRKLCLFSRELLPVRNGGSVIWTFFPLEVSNRTEFARLVAEVLEHEFPFPWCHHLRFIVREDPDDRPLQAVFGNWPRVHRYQPDLSAEAINRSMQEEVADENLPLEERLNTLLVMAGNDSAFNRHHQSLEKYELLLQHYAGTGNYAMAAMALNGMGEVYEKMGDLGRANESYEAALIPASHGENPPIPILLNVILNLANIHFGQKRWAEAEAYYDLAQQLATAARNPTTKIQALENRGVCQRNRGKLQEAVNSWNEGAALAAGLEDVDLCRSLLNHLHQHYAETRQSAKERELREQLSALTH